VSENVAGTVHTGHKLSVEQQVGTHFRSRAHVSSIRQRSPLIVAHLLPHMWPV